LNLKNYLNLMMEADMFSGGHNWKLKVKRCRLQVRKCFFTQRITNVWNKLPEYVVESFSVVMFKKRLDDWSMDVEL